ncbi:hypothetical protein BpHYR1_029141 [Brachionus plicatilis]|uniref:Uncharacterized protein n=1 Tax=Brachionus plicatilis TaxID=10195 RepID=A0A3M7QS74_BRAPC|nr:hypothetical protein BpHYR1_029141 [Brachionus plicatilis]
MLDFRSYDRFYPVEQDTRLFLVSTEIMSVVNRFQLSTTLFDKNRVDSTKKKFQSTRVDWK